MLRHKYVTTSGTADSFRRRNQQNSSASEVHQARSKGTNDSISVGLTFSAGLAVEQTQPGSESAAASCQLYSLCSAGASLKLSILNPKGRIWTMVAGGGASVIYADTVGDLGLAHELGNYAEYSGAPNTAETYAYAKTLLDWCAPPCPSLVTD